MKFFLIIIAILAMNTVCAATIHGTVYNIDLNLVENAIVQVNSIPKQTMVAKDGKYSFKLQNGDYVINAKYSNGNDYFVEEKINIIKDGDYNLDLILLPDISEEKAILNEEIVFTDIDFGNKKSYWWVLIILAVVITIIIVFIKKRNKSIENDLKSNIFKLIKQNKRISQKEIRKNFAYSEAKISLVITELESEGKIKKIKKGKGNIIVIK